MSETELERLTALETRFEFFKEALTGINNKFEILFKKMDDTYISKIDLSLLQEKQKTCKTDINSLGEKVNNLEEEIETKLKKFEVIKFGIDHPKLTAASIIGLYGVSITEVRLWILQFIKTVL